MCLDICTDLLQTLQTTTRIEPSQTTLFSELLSPVKGYTIQLAAQARKLGFAPDFSLSLTWPPQFHVLCAVVFLLKIAIYSLHLLSADDLAHRSLQQAS